MTAEQWRKQGSTAAASRDVVRVPRLQAVVVIAERELERAVLEQSRPATGMHTHASIADHAAVRRAVDTICVAGRQLDLKAEELLIGIKQAWSQIAHVRARQLGDRDADVLREVVSSAIEMFFEAREPSTNEQRD